MAEYIEREKALEECDWYANEFCECEYAIMPLKGALENLPAADVRPVVRGKWLNDFCGKGRFSKRIVQCSLCGNFLDLDGVNAGRGDANYCPNCGAQMSDHIGDGNEMVGDR